MSGTFSFEPGCARSCANPCAPPYATAYEPTYSTSHTPTPSLQRMRRHATGPNGASGQALAEFLMILVAAIPLFLLLPMIGKYQDLNYATQMASRYVAFDATNFGNIDGRNPWKPPAQLADEVRRRFYSNTNAPVKTGDVAGDFDANRNLFWRDPWGHPLIKNFSDVGVSFGANAAKQNGGFSGTNDGQIFLNAGQIGLAAKGIYTANVSVQLANLPSSIRSIVPFDNLNMTITRHTSLVFDPWSSPTTRKTEARVGRLAPVGSGLAMFQPVIDAAVFVVDLGQVQMPKYGDLETWRDVVPADRIIPTP